MGDNLPETIGRYRVEKALGHGAMGVVYLAHDDLIDRKVAVKTLKLDGIAASKDRSRLVELFFNEAKIIGRLNHAHIAAIYDMGMQGECPYLVMEYVDGRTIKEVISSKNNLPIKSLLKVLSMIALGLHYAHQRNVLHRDIKPANVMLMRNLAPKIMDFGIARVKEQKAEEADKKGVGQEEKGVILGTPHYMSPEQVRGREMDERTDIFSLGVMAYEWISGEKPFRGKNLKEVVQAILKTKPAGLDELSVADEELASIIRKAIAKNADNRYQNAEEFSDALEIYVTNLDRKQTSDDGSQPSFTAAQLKVIKLLKRNYIFFKDFTEDELVTVFRLSGKEKYKQGDVIIEEGTSGVSMYVILNGSVSIRKQMEEKSVEVKHMVVGECFGEMSIVDKLPRSASVVAAGDTTVIAINEALLRHSNPQLGLKLYRSLAAMLSDKLRESDRKYLDLLATTGHAPKN